MGYFDDVVKSVGSLSLEKKAAGGVGLGSDYAAFRNTYWGQMQPVSYQLLLRIYYESPEVSGAINALTDAVVGDGWEIRPKKRKKNDFKPPEQDSGLEALMDQLAENEFNSVLNDIVRQLLVFGDGYLELVRDIDEPKVELEVEANLTPNGEYSGEKVTGASKVYRDGRVERIKNFDYAAYEEEFARKSKRRNSISRMIKGFRDALPKGTAAAAGDSVTLMGSELQQAKGSVIDFFPRSAETIQIDYNEHNEVIKYIQRVKHRRVDFYADQMIHFALNRFGNRVYGHSSLMSLVYTIQSKFAAEGYTQDFFRRGMVPRMMYKTKNLSEEQVKRMRQTLEQVKAQQDVILYGEVDAVPVATTNNDLQFKDLLKYLREQIFIALQVPPTLLGLSEGSNRANSQTQMEMFDRKKKALKRTIEDILNIYLFTPENFGADVEFAFKEDNTREELKRAQTYKLLETSPYIHPNEARAIYDLPPLDESELVAIGKLKEKMTPQPAFGAGKPGSGKFDHGDPNAMAPDKNSDHVDNAERQNVEQQLENKAFKKSDHLQAEIEESQGLRRPVEQGSISRHGATYNVADRRVSNYPFGATPVEPDVPYSSRRSYAIHRIKEIMREARNALNPDNSFSLNTDRADYVNGETESVEPPKHGIRPAESQSSATYREQEQDQERDTVGVTGHPMASYKNGEKGGNKAKV